MFPKTRKKSLCLGPAPMVKPIAPRLCFCIFFSLGIVFSFPCYFLLPRPTPVRPSTSMGSFVVIRREKLLVAVEEREEIKTDVAGRKK
ncbi:hypothetical protein VTJ04DRAFT_6592 [Mycothermus thermophilus]|uniref:uncharacterized protein n=1 Tax=Humicola insolens TaxID=85995 RepID=UPI0037428994